MAVASTDLLFHLTGGAANSDPNLSLGGTISVTQVGTAIHQLFDAVDPTEAQAGDTEYRAIDVKNNHPTDTLFNPTVWISLETGSTSTTVAIAWDSAGTQSVADESTAPSGVSFTTPTSKSTGIALGNMLAGQTRRIWLRRTVTALAAVSASDAGSLTVGGATA